MNLLEKIQKARKLVEKLISSINSQNSVLQGYETYLLNYKSSFNLEEENLGDKYLEETINILLTNVQLLNNVMDHN